MAGRRVVPVLATLGVVGGGYYLYTAGGDPKVAKKEIEHDATAVSNRIKGKDYSTKEAQKQGEEWAQKAGSKIDQTVADARNSIRETDATIAQQTREAQGKVSSFTKDTLAQAEKSAQQTGKEANNAIDKFDKTVERKTSEAKSGILSWLGFGK
ncbi:MAG: hypothetical protein Q9191_003490 [Dirinaria sp. TL-2023a]